jgi:KaiC/GvpD/RAD55 family RecA-like ATPase
MTPKTVEETTEGGLPIRDLFAFAGVRAIIGDPHGKLMQDEVADRIQKLVNVLRETVGIMDAFRMMDGLPGMSPEESLMARVAYRNISEMLDRVMPEWDAVCKAIHEANVQTD